MKKDFQQIIDLVESLSNEDQEQLITIMQKRLINEQRKELVEAVKESRQAFFNGDVKTGTVADLMAELEEE
jgi:hypothetical protein